MAAAAELISRRVASTNQEEEDEESSSIASILLQQRPPPSHKLNGASSSSSSSAAAASKEGGVDDGDNGGIDLHRPPPTTIHEEEVGDEGEAPEIAAPRSIQISPGEEEENGGAAGKGGEEGEGHEEQQKEVTEKDEAGEAAPGGGGQGQAEERADGNQLPENHWETLLPSAVTRHLLGFLGINDLSHAVLVSRAWRSLLLLNEVCEDLISASTIYRGIQTHVKDINWRDNLRSYEAFLSGYRRCVQHGQAIEKWYNRYKVTFLLGIAPLIHRGGPATCWTCENATWKLETGFLRGGFSFNVASFSVSNWLSIPIQSGPIESLITNPDTTFYTEATLIDKETGKFAKLYACADRDIALGRSVEVDSLAANGGVSCITICEPFKRTPSSNVPGIRTRLRYEFTAYDWTDDSVRLKCTGCWIHLDGISYEGDGGGAAAGGGGEEEIEESWKTLKRWVEGLHWV